MAHTPLLSPDLGRYNTSNECHAEDHSLTSKRYARPRRSDPFQLEVADAESAGSPAMDVSDALEDTPSRNLPPHIDDRSHERSVAGEAIQTVRRNGCGCSYHGESNASPCHK